MRKSEVELLLERRHREYIPPTPRARPKDDFNLNPFSSNGGIDTLSFVATVIVTVIFMQLALYLVRGPLEFARASLDVEKAAQWHVAKILLSALGFWVISSAFIKRWKYVMGEKIGFFRRMLIRGFLLSPMLSVWFTVFTLINGRQLRGARFVAGVATLILFHLGVVGWMIYDGALTAGPGLTVHLAQGMSPQRSLKEILPLSARKMWVPSETVMIHLGPYVSPLWKMGFSVYSDYARLASLHEETSDPASPLCEETLGYLGHPVRDCFFYNYRKLSELHPFTTPIIAFHFESKYPKDYPTESQSPIATIVPGLLSIKNLMTLMEFGTGRQSYRKFLHPIGLLRVYSSPEIAMLEASQDAQRIMFARKVLPQVKPNLALIEKVAENAQSLLSHSEAIDLDVELADVKGRVEGLERDPLGLGQSFDAEADGTAKKAGAPSKE